MAINHEVINPVVEKNSGIVASSYPNIPRDDITQEMWTWVYGNQAAVREYVSKGDVGLRLIGFRLRHVAHRFAGKETAAKNGVSYEDTHVYTTGSLRTLLSDVFDYENWQSHQVSYDTMPKAKAASNMTGDRIAMLADVSSGLDRLDDKHYNLLVWVFKQGRTYTQLGVDFGISADSARKRTDRAIDKLRSVLMGIAEDTDEPPVEYTGQRRAVSNATAMSYQSNMWEG